MRADRSLHLRTALALMVAALVAAPVAGLADGARPELAVRVGTLHVGDGTVLSNVLIVVDDGRFVSVQENGVPPEGVPLREHDAAFAAPGFVDAATQLGLDGGAAEIPEALTPDVRAADAFDVRHRDLAAALGAGTTSIGLLPAPGNVAAGRAALAGLRADGSAEVLERVGPPVFAFRAPALRADRVPSTAAGARALLEAAFDGRVWTTSGEGAVPSRSAAISLLADLRSGPALVYADRAEDARVGVLTLRTRGLTPTLVGLRASWGATSDIAALGVPCIVTDLDAEDPSGLLKMPGRLAAAGVLVTFSTGAPARSPESLRMSVALAVAHGFPTKEAVAAVTSRAAAALGAGDVVGRVATGLRADLLVFDGEPWEPASRVLLQIAGGRVVEATR